VDPRIAVVSAVERAEILSQVAGALVRSDQETWLRETGGLAANAGYTCAQHADALRAVIAIERGRRYCWLRPSSRTGLTCPAQ
jgi:hypothetical protein